MIFLNRTDELERLDNLAQAVGGGLAVVYGRRRIGKTRLLLEWCRRHGGLYTVADQSTAEVQRRYVAEAVAERLPGFGEVEYRDWRGLFSQLARQAKAVQWRGPVVFDELPYLVLASPELPSVLQRWVDHEAKEAGLVVAVAGSSQRMMQGFVLDGDAPLYGRAREILDLNALDPIYLRDVFPRLSDIELVEMFTAWGGVPRYWELAADLAGDTRDRLDRLVLDPLSPLHREPDRLLLEEIPSALEARPLLDAIGAGAHRASEIAGRIGRPATSMARPLERLMEMRLVKREVPFGESAKGSKRSLYKIDDPFVRLWFRVVAPHRGQLAMAPKESRLQTLERFFPLLVAQAWEELCRQRLPRLLPASDLGARGPWGPASRWWKGNLPEWDVVAESIDGKRLLLGEVKWRERPFQKASLLRAWKELAAKKPPLLRGKFGNQQVVRALFVPEVATPALKELAGEMGEGCLVTAADLLSRAGGEPPTR